MKGRWKRTQEVLHEDEFECRWRGQGESDRTNSERLVLQGGRREQEVLREDGVECRWRGQGEDDRTNSERLVLRGGRRD